MAPMAATLPDDAAINNVVAYIKTLPDTPAPATVKGNVKDGEDTYVTCGACHGVKGQGIQSTNAPRLKGMSDWYMVTQLKNFKQGIRGTHPKDLYGTQMNFMKKDVVHSTLVGAAIGVVLSILVLVVAHLAGWTETAAGWVPFIFLAIVVLGFSTWEGGLFGIHKPNFHLARFEEHIKNDKHILFVDLAPNQEEILTKVLKSHPKLEPAGSESLHRHWFVAVQKKVPQFFRHTFP